MNCTGACTPATYPSPFNGYPLSTIFGVVGTGSVLWKAGLAHPAFYGTIFPLVVEFVGYLKVVQNIEVTVPILYHGVLQLWQMPLQTDNVTADAPMAMTSVVRWLVQYNQLEPLTYQFQDWYYTHGYLLQTDLPQQAQNEIFIDQQYYGIPYTDDTRGWEFNEAIFKQCNLIMPPTPTPLGYSWPQIPRSNWTYATAGWLFGELRRCGVAIPYWQQECTTLDYIASWMQSERVPMWDAAGNYNWNTPEAEAIWMGQIIPSLRAGGDEMVCTWINCTAPDMAEYLLTSLGQYDPYRGCSLGQETCSIPITVMPGVGSGMVIVGTRAWIPSNLTFQAFWYLTSSARSGPVQKQINWWWIAFNSDFKNPNPATNIGQIYQETWNVPVLTSGRAQGWTAALRSAVSIFVETVAQNPAFPTSPYPFSMTPYETLGGVNQLIACLIFKGGSFSYCSGALNTFLTYYNLPDCNGQTDIRYTYDACSNPAAATSTATVVWNAAVVNSTCRISFLSVLPNQQQYSVPCAYLASQSANSQTLLAVMSLTLILCAIDMVLLSVFRKEKDIKVRSWKLQIVFSAGCMIISGSTTSLIGPLSDSNCQSLLGFFSFGYVICMTTNIVKLHHIYRIFTSSSLHVKVLSFGRGLGIFALFMGINAILFGSWSATTSPKLRLDTVQEAQVGAVPHPVCYLGTPDVLVPWLLYILFLALLQGFFVVQITRSVTKSFTESQTAKLAEYDQLKGVAYLNLAAVIIVIPIIQSNQGQTSQMFVLAILLQGVAAFLILPSFYGDLRTVLWIKFPGMVSQNNHSFNSTMVSTGGQDAPILNPSNNSNQVYVISSKVHPSVNQDVPPSARHGGRAGFAEPAPSRRSQEHVV